MKNPLFRFVLWILLVLSYLLFSYNYFNGWWYSSFGTVFIFIFSFLLWKKSFLAEIGLKIRVKTVFKSFLLALFVIAGSWLVMKTIAHRQNVIIDFIDWRNFFHDIFYVLNEEIVLGAIILFSLVKKLKIKPLFASFILAVIFSMVHFVFYKWVFYDRGNIEWMTLTTLFLVGFVRNNLILKTGHIGYSWALHFGWMVIMFGSPHLYEESEKPLSELTRFNTYLGSVEMLLISFMLAFISFNYLKPGYTKVIFSRRLPRMHD